MVSVFERGAADLKREVKAEFDIGKALKDAKAAVRQIKARAFEVARNIQAEISSAVRRVILDGNDLGDLDQGTVGQIKEAFEGWVDTRVIDPLTQKEIKKEANRLATIARTEATDSYNRGRLVAARDPALKAFIVGMKSNAVLDDRTCFAAGTLVRLSNNETRPIEEIKPGDSIVSGAGSTKRVNAIKVAIAHSWTELSLNSGRKIRATTTHPFWAIRSGRYSWVEAKDLVPGDEIGTIAMPELRQTNTTLSKQAEEVLQSGMLLGPGKESDMDRASLCMVHEDFSGAADICRTRQRISNALQQGVSCYPQATRYGSRTIGKDLPDVSCRIQDKTFLEVASPLLESVQQETGDSTLPHLQAGVREQGSEQAAVLQRRVLSEIGRGNVIREVCTRRIDDAWDELSAGSEHREVFVGLSGTRNTGHRGGRGILASQPRGVRREERERDPEQRMEIVKTEGTEAGERGNEGRAASCIDHSSAPRPDGTAAVVSVKNYSASELCYDLEVEGDHTYLVEDGIIVHNTEICRFLDGKVFLIDDPDLDNLRPPRHHNALAAGELIRTKCGEKPIEEVRIGDLVWTHRSRWRPVYSVMHRSFDGTIRKIKTPSAGVLLITEEHPVLTYHGWRKAGQLQTGDQLFEHQEQHPRGACDAIVDPQDFPTLFDEEFVAWDSVKTALSSSLCAVDLNGNPMLHEREVDHESINRVLEYEWHAERVKDRKQIAFGLCRVFARMIAERLGHLCSRRVRAHWVQFCHSLGMSHKQLVGFLSQSMSPMVYPGALSNNLGQSPGDLHLLGFRP
ncbi:MAG: Hint domain-containing protein, partial [Nitrososphaera sp.]|nr:Hint domain-containing protein [Nitrososphaera sp.]